MHSLAIIDVIAITGLMHLSGGITSGFGILMIAAIAGGSLLLPGRSALLFAAYAALALLAHEILNSYYHFFDKTSYTQTGLVGIALFTTALVANGLAKRASEVAVLAARRGVDLANLVQLNEHLVNRMEAGIIVVDDKANIKLMNRAAWTMLGEPSEQKTENLFTLCAPLYEMFQTWTKHQDLYEGCQYSDRLKRPGEIDLQIRLAPVGARREDKGTVIYLYDTSDVDKQMQEMKLASLGRLTASIAHEIRNPLGAISHAAQLLKESTELSAADQRLSGIIQDQSARLNHIINTILRLSRRERPNPEEIVLNDWLQDFVEEFGRIHDLKEGWVHMELRPIDGTIHMDSTQLHQVLSNLCSNAKKYGALESGTPLVTLKAHIFKDTAHSYLDVINSGQTINHADQAKLFEPFFTTSSSGTGLGLYISRELCKNNGGDLTYIGSYSNGTCFRIIFPLSSAYKAKLQLEALYGRGNLVGYPALVR